jgi:hypothetical protein
VHDPVPQNVDDPFPEDDFMIFERIGSDVAEAPDSTAHDLRVRLSEQFEEF